MKHGTVKRRKQRAELVFPRWAFVLFLISAAFLTPWTYSLAWFLPTKHVAHNWDTAWVGFDMFMLAMFVLTMIFAYRRSLWSVMTSVALATLLFVDAWFDILTAAPGSELRESVVSATFETGLGLLILYLVYSLVSELRSELRV